MDWLPLGNKRAVMLTLLVTVLFILMLSEVVTYIVVSIEYETLAGGSSIASNAGGTSAAIESGTTQFLHASLSSAMSTLIGLEANPSARKNVFVNNTDYMITSLMTNGTLYGHNFSAQMGTALMYNYSNVIKASFGSQGTSYSMTPGNLTVYQSSPSLINATYTALLIANSSEGTFTYPIRATTSVQLNGTADLTLDQQGVYSPISIRQQYPQAARIGGTALAGSNSPFMFVAGPVITIASGGSCSNVPSRYQSSSYILMMQNAQNINQQVCNMGGLIANVVSSTTPDVPYLVYSNAPGSGNVFSLIQNGTYILLDGPAFALYNTSALQTAINNNYYYTSKYVPSYLSTTSGSLQPGGTGAGLFSFNLLNYLTPWFSDASGFPTTDNIVVSPSATIPANSFTISFWIYKDPNMIACDSVMGKPDPSNTFLIYSLTSGGCGAGNTYGQGLTFKYTDNTGTTHDGIVSGPVPPGTFVNMVLVFNGPVAGSNTITWYENGQLSSQYTDMPDLSADTDPLTIGSDTRAFNGSISDVQIYNAPLSGSQIAQLYLNGIAAPPQYTANLIAWYPLNGNANDYSSYSNNGVAYSVTWKPLSGYFGDPVYQRTMNDFNSSVLAGIDNCNNPTTCQNTAMSHVYMQNLPLSTSQSGAPVNESATFGLGGALAPGALSFDSGGYVITTNNLACTYCTLWMNQGGQPAIFVTDVWVYPYTGSGVVLDGLGQTTPNTGTSNSLIELVNGVGYARWMDGTCQSLGTIPIEKWTNIEMGVYGSAGSYYLYAYVNGALKVNGVSLPGTSGVNPFYFALGSADSHNCGSGISYNGLLADFQVVPVDASSASSAYYQLYLNNTVAGYPTNVLLPLDTWQNGQINTTSEVGSTPDPAFLMGTAYPCTPSNVISGACGVQYVP